MRRYSRWCLSIAGYALVANTVLAGSPPVVIASNNGQQPEAIAKPATPEPTPIASSIAPPADAVLVQGDNAGPTIPCDQGCPEDSRLSFRGWLNAGFMGNTDSPKSRFNGPYNAIDRSNEWMFNQAYFITEYKLPKCGFGVGGRVDVLYGEDFLLAQSRGFETRQDATLHWNNQYYGLALPQAYGEFGNENLNLKVGHFYSIVGYEGLQAPDNAFYSKSYSYQFAGPFTHWGALGTSKVNENLQVQVGLVNGWNALDRPVDAVNYLVGAKYAEDCWWSSFAIITGEESTNVASLPGIRRDETNATRYSFLLGLSPSCRLDYVFHHWFGWQQSATADGQTAMWYGIDQYLYYKLTETVKLAGRFEWFRDEDGVRLGLNRPSNPNKAPFIGNVYSLSFGVNWLPTQCLMVRPEIRADWFDGDQARKPYQDGGKDYQLLLGVDVIYKF